MLHNMRLTAARLLVYATLVAVTAVHATPSRAQDADIKKQLEGVDLDGVQQLRLSPDGELAAGFTKLYDNPGPRSGSFSLIKIWSVKKKEDKGGQAVKWRPGPHDLFFQVSSSGGFSIRGTIVPPKDLVDRALNRMKESGRTMIFHRDLFRLELPQSDRIF